MRAPVLFALLKLDFVTAFLCTFIINIPRRFMVFVIIYFHYFYLSSLLTSQEHHAINSRQIYSEYLATADLALFSLL